jgi:hypothetical protein
MMTMAAKRVFCRTILRFHLKFCGILALATRHGGTTPITGPTLAELFASGPVAGTPLPLRPQETFEKWYGLTDLCFFTLTWCAEKLENRISYAQQLHPPFDPSERFLRTRDDL